MLLVVAMDRKCIYGFSASSDEEAKSPNSKFNCRPEYNVESLPRRDLTSDMAVITISSDDEPGGESDELLDCSLSETSLTSEDFYDEE